MALESITKWAAYQYFEENTKGTLTAGKLADMVVLDKNPLKIEPGAIKDIQILETIKEGKLFIKMSYKNAFTGWLPGIDFYRGFTRRVSLSPLSRCRWRKPGE